MLLKKLLLSFLNLNFGGQFGIWISDGFYDGSNCYLNDIKSIENNHKLSLDWVLVVAKLICFASPLTWVVHLEHSITLSNVVVVQVLQVSYKTTRIMWVTVTRFYLLKIL